jgi:23S rRNA pseudouridine2605 synthase
MRLSAYLARAGVASRRAAGELVKAGRVSVNGRPGTLDDVVSDQDDVRVDGTPAMPQRARHVLLHKPRGVVTTVRDPQRRPTVVELVSGLERVVPVGRLDIETSGALVLTNDGPLAHRLAHPRHGVEKTYVADVTGLPSEQVVEALATGVDLDDGRTSPARVRLLGRSRIELVLHEGRNRQVRRMCEAVGHPVLRLHRSGYAGLGVKGLGPGESRELTQDEVAALRRLVGLSS